MGRRTICAVLVATLIGCGGGGDGGDDDQADSTTTTAASTTAADASTTTTEAELSAEEAALAELAPLYETSDPAGLDYFAPGSPAFIYYEGVVLLGASDTPTTEIENGWRVDDDLTLTNFQFDAAGKITDIDRNEVPLSKTVAASGATFEGIDEGVGITGTVHSFRYFGGNLYLVVTTANEGTVEGSLGFNDYVVDGQQFSQAVGQLVRPGATVTYLEVFENVPGDGGTAYGNLWADGYGVLDAQVDVPPLG